MAFGIVNWTSHQASSLPWQRHLDVTVGSICLLVSCLCPNFQQKLEDNLTSLKGVRAIEDDILIYGEGDTDEEAEENHDQRLICLLQRAQKVGLKFNESKLKVCMKEAPFIGHRLTAEGLEAAPAKVEAFRKMPTPTDQKSVR